MHAPIRGRSVSGHVAAGHRIDGGRVVDTVTAKAWRQPDSTAHPNLFAWTDTCNVYVLRDGDSALLFDLGDGSVLSHLDEIGVKRVEWVLFTHHHREQCQGIGPRESFRVTFLLRFHFCELQFPVGDVGAK